MVKYDKYSDTLFIWFGENRPAISADCDGDFWIRKDPQTKEIIGIEIEDFKAHFLKKFVDTLKERRR